MSSKSSKQRPNVKAAPNLELLAQCSTTTTAAHYGDHSQWKSSLSCVGQERGAPSVLDTAPWLVIHSMTREVGREIPLVFFVGNGKFRGAPAQRTICNITGRGELDEGNGGSAPLKKTPKASRKEFNL